MFNIGFGEIIFIAILALIFIGPERLPQVMRQLGEYTFKLRQIVGELTRQYEDELRPLRDIQDMASNLNPGKLLEPPPSRPGSTRSTSAPAPPAPPAASSGGDVPMREIDKIIQPQSSPTPDSPPPPPEPPAPEA